MLPLANRKHMGILPYFIGRRLICRCLAEHQQIVRKPDAGPRAIFLQLLVEKPERLCPRHFDNRIFPYADARMVRPALRLMRANDVAWHIINPNASVREFSARHIGAMHRSKPSRLCDAKKLFQKKPVLREKFIIRSNIPHVPLAIRIDE